MFEKIKEKIALKSDPSSPKYRRFMAQRVCGHHIKYVTERENDIDKVIGREGGINIRDDVLTVFASSNVIFKANIPDLQTSELMSKDGVVLSGPDLTQNGRERTIIVHFVNYIK